MRTVSWRRKSQSATVLLALTMVAAGRSQSQDLTLQLAPHDESRAARYREAVTVASEFFASWLGELTPPAVIIHSASWASPPALPQVISVRSDWPLLKGDRSLERYVIAGLARRYWFDTIHFAAADRWLASGLARYTAVRAVLDVVESDHFVSPRFLGGMLAYPVRYAPMTSDWWEGRPPLATFAEIDEALHDSDAAADSRGRRAARALQTLERVLGRPTLDAAIADFAGRARGSTQRVESFVSAIEDATARDLSWFFDAAFREDMHYDYGVAQVSSSQDAAGAHLTRVVVRRYGNAVFAGTSQVPLGGFEEGRAIAVEASFADGSTVREHWDGRADARAFEFTSRSPIVTVTVDPAAVLLLDERWDNNRYTLTPPDRAAAAQWALLWMAWLQQFMLTMTAFV